MFCLKRGERRGRVATPEIGVFFGPVTPGVTPGTAISGPAFFTNKQNRCMVFIFNEQRSYHRDDFFWGGWGAEGGRPPRSLAVRRSPRRPTPRPRTCRRRTARRAPRSRSGRATRGSGGATSTRRFAARPSSVSFDAIGCVSPKPRVPIRAACTPWLVRSLTVVTAAVAVRCRRSRLRTPAS